MPKINVLYLHEASQMSGAENSLLLLARHLDREEFCPFFAVPVTGPFVDALAQNNIIHFAASYPSIRRMRGVKTALQALRAYIKEQNINLLHSNSIRTHIYAFLCAREAQIPVVWHQRNLLAREIIDPDRWLAFLPDRIICNSYAVARRFMHFGKLPRKVRVAYSGVDIKEFSPKIDGSGLRKEFAIGDDEIVIGIASRFNLAKGHEIFFQAAKRVLSGKGIQQKIRFLVAGGAVFAEDKKREESLKGLVKELGIQDSVVFAGFRSDMPRVYRAMDVLVLASAAEACGRVIFEAMASGRPVIGTNSGGTPEIVEDKVTGYLVEPNNAFDIAEKIICLLRDASTLKRMGEASRQRIEERFSAEQAAQAIGSIYLELVKR